MAAAIGLVAGLTLAYCLFFSAPVWAFMVAMGLVGAYKGFNNPPIESIFADSVQRGKRCCPCSRPILSISSLCHRSHALQVEHSDGVLSRAWLQARWLNQCDLVTQCLPEAVAAGKRTQTHMLLYDHMLLYECIVDIHPHTGALT